MKQELSFTVPSDHRVSPTKKGRPEARRGIPTTQNPLPSSLQNTNVYDTHRQQGAASSTSGVHIHNVGSEDEEEEKEDSSSELSDGVPAEVLESAA